MSSFQYTREEKKFEKWPSQYFLSVSQINKESSKNEKKCGLIIQYTLSKVDWVNMPSIHHQFWIQDGHFFHNLTMQKKRALARLHQSFTTLPLHVGIMANRPGSLN
jgi:exopolysaccharide biosynthesis protein